MTITTEAPERPQCRYLRRNDERCTGEAVDGDPKSVQLCTKHLARAMQLVAEHREAARRAKKTTRRNA